MQMHGPLMLLPPAPVTPHSPCTLDESCREEKGEEGGEELKGADTEHNKVVIVFLTDDELRALQFSSVFGSKKMTTIYYIVLEVSVSTVL